MYSCKIKQLHYDSVNVLQFFISYCYDTTLQYSLIFSWSKRKNYRSISDFDASGSKSVY